MNDTGVIASREFIKDEHCKTVSAVKSVAGEMFLDVRKWSKFSNQDEYFPRKAGIMLSFDDWNKILPQITELLNEMNGSKSANT